MRVLTTALGVLMTWGAMASPASAGGWWTYPQLGDQAPGLAIGETASVTARVMFPSIREAAGARATGGYHAYLLRGIDRTSLLEAMTHAGPGDWWSTPEEMIHLAELTLGSNDANLVSASASFVVPAVEDGGYDLMLCNLGCSEPLADVVPLESIYVGDPAIVQVLRQNRSAAQEAVDELELLQTRLDRMRTSAGEGLDELRTQVDELTVNVDRIHAVLASADMGTDAGSPSTLGGSPWAGWVAAVGLGVWVWLTRRRPTRPQGEDSGHAQGVLAGESLADW